MGTIDNLDLGKYGIYTFDFEFRPASEVRDAVQELEGRGWQSVWVPELLGREAFTHASYLLANTQNLFVINGIAKIWSRQAMWTHGASRLLADAYPDRHIVGLGVGDTKPGVKPMEALNDYLDELDELLVAGATPNPAPASPVRRILAAYGPKMLELARERSLGAHCYHVNVHHTEQARSILGPDTFLSVEQPVLLETDPERAREVAREHLHPYLNQKFNVAKFKRLGYTEEEIGGGGADRIVDELVFWGDLDSVAARLETYVEAGADHVNIQVIGVPPGDSAMPQWAALAEALL